MIKNSLYFLKHFRFFIKNISIKIELQISKNQFTIYIYIKESKEIKSQFALIIKAIKAHFLLQFPRS